MGREKALIKFKDKTLIEYSLEAVAGMGAPLVVSNNEAVLDFLGCIEVIPDFLPGRGPMGGIHAAMKHTGDDIFVVACDTPLLDRKTLEYLADKRGKNLVAVYRHEGKVFPFPGYFSHKLLADVERRLEGAGRELAIQDLISGADKVAFVDITRGVESLIGINTPAEYRRITGMDLE